MINGSGWSVLVNLLIAIFMCYEPTNGGGTAGRYCSSSYPSIDMKTWRCEWCIHDQDKQELRVNKGRPEMAAANHSMSSTPSESVRDETHNGKAITESVGDINEGNRSTRVYQDDKTAVGRTSSTGKAIRKLKVTVDRPKKPNRCHSSLHRIAGRRYKLLADVLCSWLAQSLVHQ